jgi:hypothetical protein
MSISNDHVLDGRDTSAIWNKVDARDTNYRGEVECKLALQRHGGKGGRRSEAVIYVDWEVGVGGQARRLIVVRGKLSREIWRSNPSLDLSSRSQDKE